MESGGRGTTRQRGAAAISQQAARIGTLTGIFDWMILGGKLEAMYGLPPGGFGGTQTVFENLVHPRPAEH